MAHPAEADAAEDDGQEEGRDSDGLENDVGEPRSGEAGPVGGGEAVGEMPGRVDPGNGAAYRVGGGVGRSVGGEGEKEQTRRDDDYEPKDLVEAAIAGWSGDQPEWFHGNGADGENYGDYPRAGQGWEKSRRGGLRMQTGGDGWHLWVE